MKKIFILFILTLLTLPLVSSYFPSTHYDILLKSTDEPQQTQLYEACKNNLPTCLSGDMSVDFSVIFYYTRFELYKSSHTPSACRQLIDSANDEIELSCAAGACAHIQASDLISHTEMVPHSIRSTGIPNLVIHPFSEQRFDTFVINKNPEINYDALVTAKDFEKCKPLFVRVFAARDEFFGEDVEGALDLLKDELEGKSSITGYDVQFKKLFILPPIITSIYFGFLGLVILLSVLLWARRIRFSERRTALNWITFILAILVIIFMSYLAFQFTRGASFETFQTTLARPLSKFVPIGNEEQIYRDSIEGTKEFFRVGESSLFNIDGSGEDALKAADESIKSKQYLIFGIIIALISFIIWRNFRSTQKIEKGVSLSGL